MAIHTRILAICIVSALSLSATLAIASPLPPHGPTRQDVVTWLQRHGYPATIQFDDVSQDKYVATESQGIKWSMYFFNCDAAGGCTSIQYSASWRGTLSAQKLNEWNGGKRFFRAFVTPNNTVWCQYDLDIVPGGTWELLEFSLARWNAQVASFRTFIGN